MTTFVINVFQLTNRRGYPAPYLEIHYDEKGSDIQWRMSCGGSRAYLVRLGDSLDPDIDSQAAESHFMAHRMTTALLLGGAGLFEANAVGRLLFTGAYGDISWTAQHDLKDPHGTKTDQDLVAKVSDWYLAICRHTILRRAADDAHLALRNPHEAFVFVYRGMEWIKEGLGISWEQLAQDIGVPPAHLLEMKQLANFETGVRHASRSGKKLRAHFDNYGTWVCALLDAINSARARLESGFSRMSPEHVANAVARAAPVIPYE